MSSVFQSPGWLAAIAFLGAILITLAIGLTLKPPLGVDCERHPQNSACQLEHDRYFRRERLPGLAFPILITGIGAASFLADNRVTRVLRWGTVVWLLLGAASALVRLDPIVLVTAWAASFLAVATLKRQRRLAVPAV